jgi:hypothetical protein
MSHKASSRRGIVSLLALMFMMIFVSLAIAYAGASAIGTRQAANYEQIAAARLQAESGLEYYAYVLRSANINPSLTGSAMFSDLAAKVSSLLAGKAHLQGGVGYDGATLSLPAASSGDSSQWFSATVTLSGTNIVRLRATGHSRNVQRSVQLDYQSLPVFCGAFTYGVASRSAIQINGNASVRSSGTSSDASILSATYSTTNAVNLSGNCTIQGDVYVSNPNANVTMSGNPSIGGVSRTPGIYDHIHIGGGPVEFPELNPSVFEPFAVNVIDKTTNTSADAVYENVRIKAGTNPHFSGQVTFRGVVYIEVPNQVSFTGGLDITGVIVSQQAPPNTYSTNTISFAGNTRSYGVEALPDTPQWQDLRKLGGTFLLTPGFGASFTGDFGTLNGTMAADAFSFTGNAGGRVKGTILNYSDSIFSLSSNCEIVIDRDDGPETPAGFVTRGTFAALPETYLEN